jgi:hypothetical protein
VFTGFDRVASSGAFLELADKQISAPAKARQRAAEKRAETRERDKALEERDRQARMWRAWRRAKIEELLAGPYGTDVKALVDFLEQLSSASELIEFIKCGPWHNADSNTRFVVLGLVDLAIVEVREKRGLPPFDDPLPGEPPNAFLTIREWLR